MFVDSGDSTFVATADDAESTFALDVDTGSLPRRPGPARRAAPAPDPASIRVEEWVERVRLRRSGADRRRPSASTSRPAAAPHADDGTPSCASASTPPTSADADRPPANITFVIDTSGSMDIRDRLGLVKSSLALLVAAPARRRHDRHRHLRRRRHAGPRADAGRRRRAHHRRHRRARPGRQHEHGGRPAARLRAGPRRASTPPPSTSSCWRPTASPTSASPTRRCSPSRSPRPARRASTSSPSATAWATTTTT